MTATNKKPCELCTRELELTEHHLIPRETHNKKWCQKMFTAEERKGKKALLCHDCHDAIHAFIPNKELAMVYNSVEALESHKTVQTFVRWVSKDVKRKFKR